MARHFGLQTARVGLIGGNPERPLSRHGARNTGAELIQLAHPPGLNSRSLTAPLIPAGSILERDNLLYSVRDCLPVVGAALFLAVTGIALTASVFMMFFCDFG